MRDGRNFHHTGIGVERAFDHDFSFGRYVQCDTATSDQVQRAATIQAHQSIGIYVEQRWHADAQFQERVTP